MTIRCRMLPILLTIGVCAGCEAAATPQADDRDITAGDMRARIGFLASDMLRGRATPSPGLDVAARYIASEFRRFGLEPLRGDGYILTYRLARAELGQEWSLALERGDRRAWLRYGTDFWGFPAAAGRVEGRLRFMGDRPGAAPVPSESPAIWVAQATAGTSVREWLRAATAGGAAGLLLVVPESTTARLQQRFGPGERVVQLGDVESTLAAALVTDRAFRGALGRLGVEATAVAADGADGALGGLGARMRADLRMETVSAPNVAGVLPGSDPALADEYVIVSAHMDGLGVGRPLNGDSIYNGADDNASGTSAVLEVAEAMAALDPAPARSVVFLAVSGEEIGLLGSSGFVSNPPLPLDRVVANLNVDMVGRNWEDTISVIGKPYSTLGGLVDSVAAAQPELRLAAVGDLWPQERFFFRSDHYNFARKGIPAIFFFSGVHEDYHQPSDEADRIKYEKATRVARLIYEVASAVANAEEPPRWDPAARERIVGTR